MSSEGELEYSRLMDPVDDSGTKGLGKQTSQKRDTCHTLAITAFLLIALLVLVVYLQNVHSLSATQPIKSDRITCGTNLADAIKQGCTWDALTQSWLPKECPRAGEAEYLAAGDHVDQKDSWIFYEDPNGNTRVDRSIMVPQNSSDDRARQTWWATEGEHLTHCIYLLQRLAFAAHSGGRMDHQTGNYNHTIHCITVLFKAASKSPTWNNITQTAHSGFGFC